MQNFEFAFSLLPQLVQNFASGSSVSLSRGVNCGWDIWSVGADSIPPYISVTAPLGLNESSVSGARSYPLFLQDTVRA